MSTSSRTFVALHDFIDHKMRISHVCQQLITKKVTRLIALLYIRNCSPFIIAVGLVLLPLVASDVHGKTLEGDQVSLRYGKYYEINQSEPYTGLHIMSRYPNGQVKKSVEVIDGVWDGKIKGMYADGTLKYSATFSNGVLNGQLLELFDNGQYKKLSNAVNGEKEGAEKKWFRNGAIEVVTAYTGGSQSGDRYVYYKDGSMKSQCHFINGQEDGICKSWHPTGSIATLDTYLNGVKDGPFEYSYFNSVVKERGNKADGVYSGQVETFYDSGISKSLCTYMKGKLNGECKNWNNLGDMESSYTYLKDQKNGHYTRWSGGLLAEEGAFQKDKLDGVITTYYDNGKKHTQSQHQSGVRDGAYQHWWKSGLTKETGAQEDGRKHGQIQTFFEEGGIQSRTQFAYGLKHGLEEKMSNQGVTYAGVTFSRGKKDGLYFMTSQSVEKHIDYFKEYGDYISGYPRLIKREGVHNKLSKFGKIVTLYRNHTLVATKYYSHEGEEVEYGSLVFVKNVKNWLESKVINTFGRELGVCSLEISVAQNGLYESLDRVECGGKNIGKVIKNRLSKSLSEMPESIRSYGSFKQISITGVNFLSSETM